MKLQKISLLVLTASLALAPALRAEDKPAKPEGRPERPAGGPGARGDMAKERLDKLTEDLKLTAEQKTKVEAVLKAQAEKRRELRDATQEERQEKAKAMREETDKKMKEILTAEQYEKWTKVREQNRGPGANGEGRPRGKKNAENN